MMKTEKSKDSIRVSYLLQNDVIQRLGNGARIIDVAKTCRIRGANNPSEQKVEGSLCS